MAKKPAKAQPAKAKAKPTPQVTAPLAAEPTPPRRRPNITEVVDVSLSCCRKCQSTERTPYTNTTDREIAGLTPHGRPYTHIVWRSTTCATCGQARRDRTFENRKSGT